MEMGFSPVNWDSLYKKDFWAQCPGPFWNAFKHLKVVQGRELLSPGTLVPRPGLTFLLPSYRTSSRGGGGGAISHPTDEDTEA